MNDISGPIKRFVHEWGTPLNSLKDSSSSSRTLWCPLSPHFSDLCSRLAENPLLSFLHVCVWTSHSAASPLLPLPSSTRCSQTGLNRAHCHRHRQHGRAGFPALIQSNHTKVVQTLKKKKKKNFKAEIYIRPRVCCPVAAARDERVDLLERRPAVF